MQIYLEIRSGIRSGERIPVATGTPFRLGRTAPADLIFPFDESMSRLHFMIEPTITGCRVRDLNSSNGTFLNNKEIAEADLANGDELLAGETSFAVFIEQQSNLVPAVADAEFSDSTHFPAKAQLLSSPELQPLFVVLDAATEPEVLKFIHEAGTVHESLLSGARGTQLAHFAPYLARVESQTDFLRRIVQKAFGKNWGIFIVSSGSFDTLIQHLRQMLVAKTPEGTTVHFRYYDPRILRAYLPTCLPEEAKTLFGPVTHFITDDGSSETLLIFSALESGVQTKLMRFGVPDD